MNITKIFDFIKEKRGYEYPIFYKLIYNLPLTESDLKIDGDIDFRGYHVSKFPENMVVNGRMDISYTTIESLPDNLTVTADLVCSGSRITKLPDNLTVYGDVFCGDSVLSEIGHNINIGGILTLYDTPIKTMYSRFDMNRMLEKHNCWVENGIKM